MSGGSSSSSGNRPDGTGGGNDNGNGQGRSGEGAGSAMEAMLRKRQMRVDPQPDTAGPPTTQQQDGKAAEE